MSAVSLLSKKQWERQRGAPYYLVLFRLFVQLLSVLDGWERLSQRPIQLRHGALLTFDVVIPSLNHQSCPRARRETFKAAV